MENAAEFRCEQIDNDLVIVLRSLERIKESSRGSIGEQLESVKKQIDTIASELISWPGEGQTPKINSNSSDVDKILHYRINLMS